MTSLSLLLTLSGCLLGYYDHPADSGGTSDGGASDGGGGDGGCDLQTWYRDADGDGYGSATDTVDACAPAPKGYVADSSDCDDTEKLRNPGLAEDCDDGLDNDCDASTDAACTLGDAHLDDAILSIKPQSSDLGDYLGGAVAFCGDLDNDGVPDMAIGAPGTYDDKAPGAAWFVSGVTKDVVEVEVDDGIWGLTTSSEVNRVGNSIACDGDIQDDSSGFADVFVSAPYQNMPGADGGGRVVMVLGPFWPDNPDDSFGHTVDYRAHSDLSIEGENVDGYLGIELLTAELDSHEGVDLLVSEPGYLDTSGNRTGMWYLFSDQTMLSAGSSAHLSDADFTVTNSTPETALGDRGSATAGDFDGDGVQDVAFSAQQQDNDGNHQDVGRVWVLTDPSAASKGGSLDLATNPGIYIKPGNTSDMNFGAAMAAGDVTGDGVDDLVVLSFVDAVAAKVFDLSGVKGDVQLSDSDDLLTIGRSAPGCGGYAVDARGDIDGDGALDLAFDGSCTTNSTAERAGFVWGFYGNLVAGNLETDDADFSVTDSNADAFVGRALSTGADIDGDGRSDLLVGAPGHEVAGGAFLFLGQGI